MTIAIVNPLPTALEHYASEIVAVLTAAGYRTYTVPTPTIESVRRTLPVMRTFRSLLSRFALRGVQDEAVVLWPTFGLLDPISFAGRRGHTWLLFHDSVPLRRQFGMRRWAGRLGRHALNDQLTIVVHSEPAGQVMAQRGWAVATAPHPVLPPTNRSAKRGTQVRVLGQWKPSRSLDLLEVLAADPTLSGRREIIGRGWPNVPGWNVDARFLTEAELNRHIADSAAVVVPYEHYFQSGIAVRCLEQGTPVVGRSHPFLAELYGADWPGTVIDEDWSSALARAIEQPPEELNRRHAAYWELCVEAWRGLLARVVGAGGGAEP